jgi:hypothetical protein
MVLNYFADCRTLYTRQMLARIEGDELSVEGEGPAMVADLDQTNVGGAALLRRSIATSMRRLKEGDRQLAKADFWDSISMARSMGAKAWEQKAHRTLNKSDPLESKTTTYLTRWRVPFVASGCVLFQKR